MDSFRILLQKLSLRLSGPYGELPISTVSALMLVKKARKLAKSAYKTAFIDLLFRLINVSFLHEPAGRGSFLGLRFGVNLSE